MVLSIEANNAPLRIIQELTNVEPILLDEKVLLKDKEVLVRAGISYESISEKKGVELWDNYRFDTRVLGLLGMINDPRILESWKKMPSKRDNQIDERVRSRRIKTWQKMRENYTADIFPYMVVNTKLSRLKYYRELINWFFTDVQPLQSVIEIGSAADQILLSISENSFLKPKQFVGLDRLSVKQALRRSSLAEMFLEPGWENISRGDYVTRLNNHKIQHHTCDVREIQKLRDKVADIHPRILIFSHILEYFKTNLIYKTLEESIEIFKPDYVNIFSGLFNHGFRNPSKPESKTINLLYNIKYEN